MSNFFKLLDCRHPSYHSSHHKSSIMKKTPIRESSNLRDSRRIRSSQHQVAERSVSKEPYKLLSGPSEHVRRGPGLSGPSLGKRMPSQNIGDISPESFKKKDMSSTNVFSIGQSRSRSRNTHNLKKDFSIFSKDIQQINDLHASNQDLVLQQKTIKRRFMDNLNMKLRSKTSPRVRGNIDTEGTPRSYSRISDRSHIKSKALTRKLAHAFEMHHDANLNLMLKVQEAYYMQHLVNFIDDEIRSKLKQAKKCNYKNKFKTVFRARQKIERTLERERFEAKKRVAKKTRVVDKLEKFINEFDDEIARRAVELKSKMKENTHNQIQCYLSEMEYLYTNDPQSVLEDTDRQISFIKEDLMKGEDKLKQMKNGSRGNEDLIQKYLRLKKQL